MDTIQDTVTKFTADPESARTAPAVTATLANGFVRASAGPFNWDIDLPGPLGGGNQAPSPTAYFLGALAGCAVAFLNDTLAPEFGVQVDDLTAVARCRADLAGLVGIEGTDPALTDLALEIQLASPSDAPAVEAMQRAWEERCPIYLAILRPNTVALTLTTTAPELT